MKRVKGTSSVFAVATTALLSILWQAGQGNCCIGGGRYGRYENWPTTNDWEELLILLTGKYGKNGWGWTQKDSYAYNSMGDYPFGTLKYSSTPWGASGSSGGGGSSGSYSSHSTNSLSSSTYDSGSSSKLTADKFKDALKSYFKSQPSTSTYGSGGGGGSGGFVGESFVDSPRPGPPYDDSPQPGPPYAPSSHDNSGGGLPAFGPPYETSSWPGPDSSSFGNSPAPPGGSDHQSSWPLPQGPSSSGPPPSDPHNSNFNNEPPHPISHSNNDIGGGGGPDGPNQFQSDYDTFGGGGPYGKKRRRQGRRRSESHQPQYSEQSQTKIRQPPPRHHRQRQAGLRTRPIGAPIPPSSSRPFKFPPYPGGNRPAASRKQRRMGPPMSIRRRLLKTSFGGYKVDHSRLRSLT